jgi:hypothetical protein
VDRNWPAPVAGTGIVPLAGGSATLTLPGGRRLVLVGLQPSTSHDDDPRALCRELAAAPDADLRLVLGHSPSFVRWLPRCGGADIALAGHTHGGQVVVPLYGAPITKSALHRRYASGFHEYAGTLLHVSAGIGMERMTAPQIRFGCPPEICLLEVRY